jgi:hypothetical protein
MPTSAQLERKAGPARERVSDRIANLRYHVSPTTVVSDLLQGVNPRAWGDDVLPILAKQARNNPIASILIAAGIGWLIFSEVRGPLAKSFGLTAPRQRANFGRKKKRTARSSKAAAGGRAK